MFGRKKKTLEPPSWYGDVPRNVKLPTTMGIAIIAVTVMGFGVWGNAAPLSGAIVASGVFVATGQNKVVQHLEGGIISDIAVKEGDRVIKGQVLVTLDNTVPQAEMNRLRLRQDGLLAVEARIKAEIEQEDKPIFPKLLMDRKDDPAIAHLMQVQETTFNARRAAVDAEIAGQETGIASIKEKISGSQIQMKAVRSQIALVDEELNAKKDLLAKGYAKKTEVLALQRLRAGYESEAGRLAGEIGDAKERIDRAKEQIEQIKGQAVKIAAEDYRDVTADLNDNGERLKAAEGIAQRISIRAPVNGAIVKLRYHANGGVVEPGKPIMEIVPEGDELIIEARTRPQDISRIQHGKGAEVRLTSLNQRTTPLVKGEVIYVSPDAIPDEKNFNPDRSNFYVVRIKLDTVEAAQIADFRATPGMPADVYIQTSERTFFEYLMQPLRDSMAKAFKET
jgi:HlyD family type I secretion membrane fusion protein